MPWGIVIPAEESAPLEFRLFGPYTDYQGAVGGYFQAIDADSVGASFMMNEDGKNLEMPMNRRATLMLWMVNRAFYQADVLNGDVVLIGMPDDEGETLDVPDALVTLLMKTEIYKYEVETHERAGKWYGNQSRFDNYFEACNYALGLLERWILAADVRVVAA
jgi:hypothetical protein